MQPICRPKEQPITYDSYCLCTFIQYLPLWMSIAGLKCRFEGIMCFKSVNQISHHSLYRKLEIREAARNWNSYKNILGQQSQWPDRKSVV